jgi:hypothetical protein
VVSFTPRPLYPCGERASGTHWIGGCVDPRAGLDNVEKRKFLTLPISDLLVVQAVASHYTDYGIKNSTIHKKVINASF